MALPTTSEEEDLKSCVKAQTISPVARNGSAFAAYGEII